MAMEEYDFDKAPAETQWSNGQQLAVTTRTWLAENMAWLLLQKKPGTPHHRLAYMNSTRIAYLFVILFRSSITLRF